MLDLRDETVDGTFPFAPRYHDVNGFAMHFADEGNGEPIVLAHGDPTWGYLWRKFIPPLDFWTRTRNAGNGRGMRLAPHPTTPHPRRRPEAALGEGPYRWDRRGPGGG